MVVVMQGSLKAVKIPHESCPTLVKLDQQVMTIGRSQVQCDMSLPSMELSRVHCSIIKRDYPCRWLIKDEKSSNGTWVNGKRIESDNPYELKNGDNIHFSRSGKFFYKFQLESTDENDEDTDVEEDSTERSQLSSQLKRKAHRSLKRPREVSSQEILPQPNHPPSCSSDIAVPKVLLKKSPKRQELHESIAPCPNSPNSQIAETFLEQSPKSFNSVSESNIQPKQSSSPPADVPRNKDLPAVLSEQITDLGFLPRHNSDVKCDPTQAVIDRIKAKETSNTIEQSRSSFSAGVLPRSLPRSSPSSASISAINKDGAPFGPTSAIAEEIGFREAFRHRHPFARENPNGFIPPSRKNLDACPYFSLILAIKAHSKKMIQSKIGEPSEILRITTTVCRAVMKLKMPQMFYNRPNASRGVEAVQENFAERHKAEEKEIIQAKMAFMENKPISCMPLVDSQLSNGQSLSKAFRETTFGSMGASPAVDAAVNAVLNEVENDSTQQETTLSKRIRELKDELTCPICQDSFIKTSTIQCGHSYCEPCINSWLSKRLSCPICRDTVDKPPVHSRAVDNAVEVTLRCNNKEAWEALEKRKEEFEESIKQDERTKKNIEDALQEALEKDLKCVQIFNPWTERERHRFLKGVSYYRGAPREAYCASISLTNKFITNASMEKLQVAAKNILGDGESYTKDTCTDVCIRNRLQMFMKYR